MSACKQSFEWGRQESFGVEVLGARGYARGGGERVRQVTTAVAFYCFGLMGEARLQLVLWLNCTNSADACDVAHETCSPIIYIVIRVRKSHEVAYESHY